MRHVEREMDAKHVLEWRNTEVTLGTYLILSYCSTVDVACKVHGCKVIFSRYSKDNQLVKVSGYKVNPLAWSIFSGSYKLDLPY